jgi:aspartate ammonia-lyase
MNQKRPNNIVQCTKHPLSFAVLGGCVRTRGAKKDAVASQKGSGGIVKELRPIIGLKTAHRIAELCVSVRNKLNNMLMDFRFMTQRKYPTIMGKIIN